MNEALNAPQHTLSSPAHATRLLRQIRRDYFQTHNFCGSLELCGYQPLNAAFIMAAAANLTHAEALYAAAYRLPLTRTSLRVREAAESNLDVAREVIDTVAKTANAAPKLH
jgi:hypothetical protein